MTLAVELHGTIVGTLEGDARSFDFVPSAEGIERFGANSSVLSVAIPLLPLTRRDHAGRRRNWFGELLPEGIQYDYMLQQGGLRPGDTLGFLARYGRDVAGAVQVWDPDDPTEPRAPTIRPVTRAEVRGLLEDPIGSPLANAPGSGKSSLGGVQPKVVLTRTREGWAQALGGYPSTHILKPQLAGNNASMIFDEEYGSRIAHTLGLADFATHVEDFDGLAALVIERYDRVGEQRVHQEDFNQALGASGNEKYQEPRGVVSLQRVADTLTRHCPQEDLVRFAQMVIMAVAIGNLDMHTKNIGLLHPADGSVRLTPAYDVVPQAHLSNDGRLALAVNRKYRLLDVTADDLLEEFTSWGLKRAAATVGETLERLKGVVMDEAPLDQAFPALQEQILSFISRLRTGSS